MCRCELRSRTDALRVVEPSPCPSILPSSTPYCSDYALKNGLIGEGMHSKLKMLYPACKLALEVCDGLDWAFECLLAVQFCQVRCCGVQGRMPALAPLPQPACWLLPVRPPARPPAQHQRRPWCSGPAPPAADDPVRAHHACECG